MHWGSIVSGSAGVWSFASEWISCVNCLPQANYAVPVITDGGWGFGPRLHKRTHKLIPLCVFTICLPVQMQIISTFVLQVENKKRSVLIRRYESRWKWVAICRALSSGVAILMYLNENAIPQVESVCVVRPVTDRLIESQWGETLRSTVIALIKMEVNTAGVTKRVSGIGARACSPTVATAITLYDRLVFLYRAHMQPWALSS